MKRTTAFFLGLIVLIVVARQTTAWDQVKQMIGLIPRPTASSTVAFLTNLQSTSTKSTFVGDRTKPYLLTLASGEGAKRLTWQLTVSDQVEGFASLGADVYDVFGRVVSSTDQLVFSASTKEGTVIATATTTWNGADFSGDVRMSGDETPLRLIASPASAGGALIIFQEAHDEWTQEQPSMGCSFQLTLPVVQPGNGVSAVVAQRINQTIREQVLTRSAYVLEDRPATVAAPTTAAQAKEVFMRTCRAQLADELRSFQDDLSSVGGMFQRSVASSPRIAYNQGGILSFTTDISTYTGGAHGSNTRLAFVFDTRTGQRLQIDDVIRPDARATFDQRLGRELLHQYADNLFEESAGPIRGFVAASPVAAQRLWSRGESGLSTSTAFYLVGHGMGVVFQQYEVAPYAVGLPEVFLPYEQWSDLLKPERTIF